MNLIAITNNPRTRQTISLDDGTSFEISMVFVPMQYGWFIEELKYGDFITRSIRIVNSPNFLFQFKNIIPFGIGCISNEDREPSQLEDFSSGNSNLYLLNETEMKVYEDYLSE